jgi:hypothetical protein
MDSERPEPGNDETIVPPFNGVQLVEYHDHVALTPTYACREFVGLGKVKASAIKPKPTRSLSSLVYEHWGDQEVWVIVRWERYEDGREEATLMEVMDGTEEQARHSMQRMIDFCNMSKEELEALGECLEPTNEDVDYVKIRFPEEQPSARSLEKYDLYQARLKVLAGMQPKTVALLDQANTATDPKEKERLEREAVAAYFAELSHHWTEEEVKAWQRSNPVGTEWISVFAEVREEPAKRLDAVNHLLVLNWLRKGYNLLTAQELSDAIYAVTGQRYSPDTLKKRRERLGLTTKRSPGPRSKYELLKSKLKKLF